jgi:serine/threonine protein kinase
VLSIGIEVLHSIHIIHTDLTPCNVLFEDNSVTVFKEMHMSGTFVEKVTPMAIYLYMYCIDMIASVRLCFVLCASRSLTSARLY